MKRHTEHWVWVGLLAGLIISAACTDKPDDTPSMEVPTCSAELTPDSNVTLSITDADGATRTKTAPTSFGTSVESCGHRDGWLVASLHAGPSSGELVAWNLATDAVHVSPGYAWIGTPDHFISVHRVHFGPPEDPADNIFFYVDGESLPLVEELPWGADGSRGRFAMRLARSDRGQVIRLSFPQEDMYDSSLLLWQRPDGEWQLLGHHKKDSGSRLTINYGWDIESTYTIEWTDGTPVVHVSLESTDSKRGPMPEAKMTTETKTREGVLTPDGVIWDTPIE